MLTLRNTNRPQARGHANAGSRKRPSHTNIASSERNREAQIAVYSHPGADEKQGKVGERRQPAAGSDERPPRDPGVGDALTDVHQRWTPRRMPISPPPSPQESSGPSPVSVSPAHTLGSALPMKAGHSLDSPRWATEPSFPVSTCVPHC